MRRFSLLVLALFCVIAPRLRAEDRPEFRPAVLGSKPDSLVYTLNAQAQALFDAGQKTGAVLFSAHVLKDGKLVDVHTYHPAPDSQKLEEEVLKRLNETHVAPAIYQHQTVEVLLTGTISLAIFEGKPRIAIFLNQDPAELQKGNDFIAPQPVFGGPSGFRGVRYPLSATVVPVAGVVSAAIKVDAKGNVQSFQILVEDPPLLGFGPAALQDFEGAKFIPAFRDGDPTDCDTVLPIYYPIP